MPSQRKRRRSTSKQKASRSKPRRMSNRLLATIFMLGNVVLWGAALPIAKFAVDDTSSFLFLLYRYSFALLFSWPIMLWYWRKKQSNWKEISTIVLMELMGTSFSVAALYWGLQLSTSLESSLLASTVPIFVTLGGIFFLHEVEEKFEWLGLIIAVAGTIILVLEPVLSGRSQTPSFSLEGNLLIMLHNIIVSFYYLGAKKIYRNIPKLFITSISFLVAWVTFLLIGLGMFDWNLGLLVNQVQVDLSQSSILLPSLYMGFFGSVLGLTLYIAGQSLIEASEASLFTYLQPLVYIPLSILLHGDQVEPLMVVALVLIIIGVITAEIRWNQFSSGWRWAIWHKRK